MSKPVEKSGYEAVRDCPKCSKKTFIGIGYFVDVRFGIMQRLRATMYVVQWKCHFCGYWRDVDQHFDPEKMEFYGLILGEGYKMKMEEDR